MTPHDDAAPQFSLSVRKHPARSSGCIWPRLEGPSGIRIGGETGWLHAFLKGVPIAGLTYREALSFEDGGRAWLYATVLRVWGKAAAVAVIEGGLVDDG